MKINYNKIKQNLTKIKDKNIEDIQIKVKKIINNII